MSKKLKLGLIIGSAVGALIITAGCARSCCSHEKRVDWIVSRLESKLDLSEKQMVTVNKIKVEILAKHGEFEGIHEGIHETVLSQVKSNTFDKNAVNLMFDDKEKKLRELKNFFVDKAAEFHAILTPAQREKLAKEMEKFKGHHKRKHCPISHGVK